MAKAKKDNKDKTTVTRISASDSKKSDKASAPKKVATKSVKAATKPKKVSSSVKMEAMKRGELESSRNPLKATSNYLVGAWHELKQVRWPTRGATWSLTGAVLAFTAFFVVFILIADAAFKYLFEFILK